MTEPTDIPIILLAAGRSSRMRGADKLMQEVDGKPLIRRQAQLARAVTQGPVIVTLPDDPGARGEALCGLDITRLPVADAASGMSVSLRAGFAALPQTAPAAMLLLGDLPALTETDLLAVIAAYSQHRDALIWRGTTEQGAPGHPIIFSSRLFPEFATLTGDTGGREVVQAAGDRIVHVPLPGKRARLDLDTPEEWQAWRAAKDKAV